MTTHEDSPAGPNSHSDAERLEDALHPDGEGGEHVDAPEAFSPGYTSPGFVSPDMPESADTFESPEMPEGLLTGESPTSRRLRAEDPGTPDSPVERADSSGGIDSDEPTLP